MAVAGTSSQFSADPRLALPALREDLALHPGAPLKNGAPTWMIEDPLRGRFFRIGWLEFEVLARWECGDARLLADRVARETLLTPTIEEILSVRQFLVAHELASEPGRRGGAEEGHRRQSGLATRALHNYLMFRIPLVNPDRFLGALLPLVRPLLGRGAFGVSMVAGIVGLWLALLQWDSFVSTLIDTLSIPGFLGYAAALVGAKVLHELGHAFTARNLGLRVPRMGVAIVLLFPMLYTDTGETWRLVRRRDRFAIAAAGMRIELMLAAWCTLAWNFLPEGPLRSSCFFLATTSWMITLAINASPFMRFDGYYMMSDATGIPNLHDEAAKVLRHRLRRTLLGIAEPEPMVEGEPAPAWLFAFGAATAVYRFFLFVGIAFAVYEYFFKLLGIFLFGVEIWWFILRPAVAEFREWWRRRERIRVLQALRFLGVIVAFLALAFVPWQSRIFAKGWVRAGQEFALYSPRPAILVAQPEAGPVKQDALVAVLEAPELQLREARAVARMDVLGSRLAAGVAAARMGAGGGAAEPAGESARSTRAQLLQQQVEIQGAAVEAGRLRLLAPFAGIVVDVAYDTVVGAMVARQETLARVVDTSFWIAEILVDEDDVRRIRIGASVTAWLQGTAPESLKGRVEEIDTVPIEHLPAPMLAARFGGSFATIDEAESLKPRRSLFRVRCAIDGTPSVPQARLASFVIEGERRPFVDAIWRRLASALMSQIGF